MEIFHKDMSKVTDFNRIGIDYRKAAENDEYMVWEMCDGAPYSRYEVWKKVYAKNPDDSMAIRSIGDEEFGRYGWFVCGRFELCRKKIQEISGIIIEKPGYGRN